MEPRAITLGDIQERTHVPNHPIASMEPRAITLGDGDDRVLASVEGRCFNGAEGDHPRR